MALRLTRLVEGRELAHRWWAEREAERNLQGARGSAQHLKQADRSLLATLRSVDVRIRAHRHHAVCRRHHLLGYVGVQIQRGDDEGIWPDRSPHRG